MDGIKCRPRKPHAKGAKVAKEEANTFARRVRLHGAVSTTHPECKYAGQEVGVSTGAALESEDSPSNLELGCVRLTVGLSCVAPDTRAEIFKEIALNHAVGYTQASGTDPVFAYLNPADKHPGWMKVESVMASLGLRPGEAKEGMKRISRDGYWNLPTRRGARHWSRNGRPCGGACG